MAKDGLPFPPLANLVSLRFLPWGLTGISKDSGATRARGGNADYGAHRFAYGSGLFVVVSLQAMASGNGVFVVAGHNLNTFADMVMVSKNGLVWEPVYTGGVGQCRWVAYGGGRFLLVGVHGQTASSSDGYNWSRVVWPGLARFTSVAYGNGIFVAVAEGGIIATTVDGVEWTQRESGTTASLWQVEFLNGQFVAIGAFGNVLTSPDGVTWTAMKTDTAEWLSGIAFGGGQYIVTGGGGLIMTSPDLVTWTQQNAYTEDFLSSALYAGGCTSSEATVSWLLWSWRTRQLKLDAVPVVVGDRTFLPARAVIEALGATAPTTSISHKREVAGAKVLAGTILDLLESPELVARVREYFLEENKGVEFV